MDSLTINGSLSRAEGVELRRLVWAPHYWLNLFNNFLWRRYFKFMLCVLIGTSATEWSTDYWRLSHRLSLAVAIAIGCCCLGWLLRRHHRFPESMLRKINETGPCSITIDPTAVSLHLADKTTISLPWTRFRGWRSGTIIAAIDLDRDSNTVALPLGGLSDEQRSTLHCLLQDRLGNPKYSIVRSE